GYDFADTDALIEQQEGQTVTDIFAKHGESYFRETELLIVKRLSNDLKNTVLSVGGGLPTTKSTHNYLKKLGKVIYLEVDEDTVFKRLGSDSTRPLLQGHEAGERVKSLLASRVPIYEALADMRVHTGNKTVKEIVAEIAGLCL
ncbi:MAG: shikimate kinase, partial [Fibrobacter sp.]|nr:shikimate kinase [Fibrobacter sp.]